MKYLIQKDIENSIGSKVETFSYPFGHINKISVEYVKEFYDFAVTTRSGSTLPSNFIT